MTHAVHDPAEMTTYTKEVHREVVHLIEYCDTKRQCVSVYSHKGGDLYVSPTLPEDPADISGATIIPNKVMIPLDDYRGNLYAWRPNGRKGDVSVMWFQ